MEVSGKVTPREKSSQFAPNSGLDVTPKYYLEKSLRPVVNRTTFQWSYGLSTDLIRFGVSVRLKCETVYK